MRSMKCLRVCHLFLLILEEISALRILAYFPIPARSHHHVFQPVIKALARRGHRITYVTPISLDDTVPNVTHILYPDDDFIAKFLASLKNYPSFLPPSLKTVYVFGECSLLFAQNFCASEVIHDLVNSKDDFDVVLHSGQLAQEHVFSLVHRFSALGVSLVPIADVAWVNELSGLPDNPSYMVGFQTTLADRMDFLDRLASTAHLIYSLLAKYYYLHQMERILYECFKYEGWENRPSLYQLGKDQALILTESHHAVGYAYPRASHVKEVAGIHVGTPKALPDYIEKFLNDADNETGFIYFSLGSKTESNDFSQLKRVFLKVFSQRKEKVLFKWNSNDSSFTLGNVFISKWFPQQDVLAHSGLKLFVTHSGFQSTVETVHYGVPIVSIPTFSDQYKNAMMAESSGFGLRIDVKNVTEMSVDWAVNEVLSNPKYRNEAKRRSNLLRDRPMKPLDEAVYWIEYVGKHGRSIQPASVQLSFIESHLIDVYVAMGVICVVCAWLAKNLVRVCVNKTKEMRV